MGAVSPSTGAVILYEQFVGFDGRAKDRYFLIVSTESPVVVCFPTTTQPHAETKPKLATEYCEIQQGECCLPKRSFVDFRNLCEFDDIQFGSWVRSGRVKVVGYLPVPLLMRVRDALRLARLIAPIRRDQLVGGLSKLIAEIEET